MFSMIWDATEYLEETASGLLLYTTLFTGEQLARSGIDFCRTLNKVSVKGISHQQIFDSVTSSLLQDNI